MYKTLESVLKALESIKNSYKFNEDIKDLQVRIGAFTNKGPKTYIMGIDSEDRYSLELGDSVERWGFTGVDDLEVSSALKEVFGETDTFAIYNQSYRAGLTILNSKLPVYYDFLMSSTVIDDPDCKTLYVMYNQVLGGYEIHYNPDFIIRAALEGSLAYPKASRSEYVYNFIAFVFAHEVSHVLRCHMRNQGSTASNIDPARVNILGDSYINTELSRIFAVSNFPVKISKGITNVLDFEGECSPDTLGTNTPYRKICEFLGVPINRGPSELIVEPKLFLQIAYSPEALETRFGGNSNLFIKKVSDFLDNFVNGEVESGENPGTGEPSGKSRNSTNSKGSGGDSDSSKDDKGEDDSKDSSQKSSNDMSNEQKEHDESLKTSDAVSEARDKMKSSIDRKAREDKKKASGGTGDSNSDGDSGEGVGESQSKVLKGLGADSWIPNLATLSVWRKRLAVAIQNCLGSEEIYDVNMPSSRIEGELGRDIDVDAPSEIVISVDCSGSMGPDKFTKVLQQIEVFVKAFGYRRLKVTVIYWGDQTPVVKKTNKVDGLAMFIKSTSPNLGGTNYDSFLDCLQKTSRKYSLCIVLSDGQFGSRKESTPNIAYVRRNKGKFIYVLVDSSSNGVGGFEDYDPSAKRKSIIL